MSVTWVFMELTPDGKWHVGFFQPDGEFYSYAQYISDTYASVFRNGSENRSTSGHCSGPKEHGVKTRMPTLSAETLADLARRDRELRAKVATLSWEEAEKAQSASQDDLRAAGRLMLLVLVCAGVAGFLGLQMTSAALAGLGAAVLVGAPVLRQVLR